MKEKRDAEPHEEGVLGHFQYLASRSGHVPSRVSCTATLRPSITKQPRANWLAAASPSIINPPEKPRYLCPMGASGETTLVRVKVPVEANT